MNIFSAGLFTETNTFSPIPTGIADFNVTRPNDVKEGTCQLCEMIPFAAWQEKARARGDNFSFGLFAWAQPAGITTRSAYETLRDELVTSLQSNGPTDVVLLCLHGAMIAEGYDDCEGDLLRHIRKQAGTDGIIAVELDLHCHLTPMMIEQADIIVTYKEYPHIDVAIRGEELFDLAIDANLGKTKPTMALFDCKLVGMYPTSTPIMRNFINTMLAAEQLDGVLSVSFAHSFPFGDVPEAGAKLLVVTDNNFPLAKQLAEKLGMEVFALRHQINFESLPLDEALLKALSVSAKLDAVKHKPVLVADQSDNAGAGAPSDSTYALRWLLDHQVQKAAIAIFYDPEVVKVAIAAGIGATLQVRLGGKMGISSGDPVDIKVHVLSIKKGYQHRWPQEKNDPIFTSIGDAVALRCEGIDIIASSKRCQCFSPCIFEDFSIPIQEKAILVVKSMQHFYGAFAPIASEVIYMSAPGAVSLNIKEIPYQRMTTDDKYPWIEDPFAIAR
jgi:microcystin degradation protein MlrC